MNAHVSFRRAAPLRRIIVASPYLDMVWQAEQLAARREKTVGTTTREIAPRTTNVGMEKRVATKDVIFKYHVRKIYD
jgi:hypothetical protein